MRTLISTDSWLGGSDIVSDGTWVWEDGEDWGGFMSWLFGEPNNLGDNEDCLVMGYSTGNWNDLTCTAARAHVCKK